MDKNNRLYNLKQKPNEKRNCKQFFTGGGNFTTRNLLKGFFSLVLISSALTACNETEDSIPQMEKNRLKITVGVNQPQSRAIITGNALPDASEIGIRLDGYNGITNTKFTAATQDGKQVWNPESDIVLNSTAGTLYAYYPYKAGTDLSAIAVSTDTQTDYLYATPVGSVSEDKASVPVSLNHMLSNVNITINRGTYVGTGDISKIIIQSDGFATGGTFNAAQATPAFTSVTGTGDAIAQTVTATLDGTATDIMVVPTGTAKAVTFTATIDGVDYTATSSDVELQEGKSYEYTLSLNSTFMTTESVSVKTWTGITKESLTLEKVNPWLVLPNGVYAVAADGSPVEVANATSECIAVAFITDNQRIMIEKMGEANEISGKAAYAEDNATYNFLGSYQWGPENVNIAEIPDAVNDNFDETDQKNDFNGKLYTIALINTTDTDGNENTTANMATYCRIFNNTIEENQGYSDWYIPSCGQFDEIYNNIEQINNIIIAINGTSISVKSTTGAKSYWTSSEWGDMYGIGYTKNDGYVNSTSKTGRRYVRFVRDI